MIFNLDPCLGYRDDVEDAVSRVITRQQFILGQEVRAFEREWAEFVGVPHCVGVGNGTDAIRIALLALGVGPGDEVISPAHNVAYTALAVAAVGATNIYADIDPRTMLMDLKSVEKKLTPRTRVLLPVHLYGQMVDMKEYADFARRHGLILVEDAAQAHGALYENISPGQYSDAAAFSFYPTKNLGAWGEAGGIVTRVASVAERARLLRDGGRTDRYIHFLPGINSCLDEMQAAVLRAKLPHLREGNTRRNILAGRYRLALAKVGDISFQVAMIGAYHVYHLFVIQTDKRDALAEFLKENNVPVLTHYPLNVPAQPFAIAEAMGQGRFPQSEGAARRVLSLPMHPGLTDDQQAWVIEKIKEFYAQAS